MKFQDLKPDSPTVVLLGLTFEESKKEELLNQINDFFTNDLKFLKNGAKVVDIEKIGGNILGSKGRTDVVLTLDKFEVRPLARLGFPGLKWTEDFITNYAGDYNE